MWYQFQYIEESFLSKKTTEKVSGRVKKTNIVFLKGAASKTVNAMHPTLLHFYSILSEISINYCRTRWFTVCTITLSPISLGPAFYERHRYLMKIIQFSFLYLLETIHWKNVTQGTMDDCFETENCYLQTNKLQFKISGNFVFLQNFLVTMTMLRHNWRFFIPKVSWRKLEIEDARYQNLI